MAFQPPPHLSPSSINTWQQCPLKFKYSKIDGIREPPTNATLMGNFVHEIFEVIYASPPEERTISQARIIARDLWNNDYGERAAEIISQKDLNQFRWNSWFCVENLWGVENPEEVHVDEIEYELNGKLGGVQLKGFIDRMLFLDDGTIEIGDYKTGKVPAKKWEDDKFTQLYIYAALVQELGIGEPSQLELIYLKAPKTITRKVQQDKIHEVTETVVTVKKEIDESCDNEHFEARKSFLCNWCYFKPKCPAWR